MSRRIDHVTAGKVSAALAARAAFGEHFARHSARLAGLRSPLVDAVFARPAWETREKNAFSGSVPDRRISTDRSAFDAVQQGKSEDPGNHDTKPHAHH